MGGQAAGEKKSQYNSRFHRKSRRLLLEKSLCIEKLTWAAVPWDDCDEEYPALPVWLVVLEFRVWPSSPGMSVNRKLGIEDMHKFKGKQKFTPFFQVKCVPAIVSVWRGLVEGAVPPLRNSCDFGILLPIRPTSGERLGLTREEIPWVKAILGLPHQATELAGMVLCSCQTN